jgi:hypothetical protein
VREFTIYDLLNLIAKWLEDLLVSWEKLFNLCNSFLVIVVMRACP